VADVQARVTVEQAIEGTVLVVRKGAKSNSVVRIVERTDGKVSAL